MSSKKIPNMVGEIDAPGCAASTAMMVGGCCAVTAGEIDRKIAAIGAKRYFRAMGFGSILNAEGRRGAKFALNLTGTGSFDCGMPCPVREVRDFHKRSGAL